MIGNRLKLIRQANCLSLQELSDLLKGSELEIKRAALSHYELGITQPTKAALDILAKKLGTTPNFFYMDDWEEIKFHLNRPLKIPGKYETAFYSYLQIELEKMKFIENLLNLHSTPPALESVIVKHGQEQKIEQLAEAFRKTYNLGDFPISSVCTMLETSGWHVIELPEILQIPFLSGLEVSHQLSFILHQPLYVVDDYREALLKEIGYLYIKGEDDIHTDYLTGRFSRSVLFPANSIKSEFGDNRDTVTLVELAFMKQKYGISKRSIMRRLEELHIISQNYYDSFEDLMRLHGFPRRKQIMSETVMFYENSTLPSMRILEAYSRNLITSETMNQLLLLKNI